MSLRQIRNWEAFMSILFSEIGQLIQKLYEVYVIMVLDSCCLPVV